MIWHHWEITPAESFFFFSNTKPSFLLLIFQGLVNGKNTDISKSYSQTHNVWLLDQLQTVIKKKKILTCFPASVTETRHHSKNANKCYIKQKQIKKKTNTRSPFSSVDLLHSHYFRLHRTQYKYSWSSLRYLWIIFVLHKCSLSRIVAWKTDSKLSLARKLDSSFNKWWCEVAIEGDVFLNRS